MRKYDLISFLRTVTGDKTIGGFAGIYDLGDSYLVAGTDGVGTKLIYANYWGELSGIGIDLVAMCVNDIVAHGAKPIFFLDYFSCAENNFAILQKVLESIMKGCDEAGCRMIGGETAISKLFKYRNDFDIAGFAVGVVDKWDYLPRDDMEEGDVILGLQSDGVHCNGFSKIVAAIKDESLYDPIKADLLKPTKIYVKSILKTLPRTVGIKGFANITGDGVMENIVRVVPQNLWPEILRDKLPKLPIFEYIQKHGSFTEDEMFETFNMGIGMAVIVNKEDAQHVAEVFEEEGEIVHWIGKLISNKKPKE